MMPPPAPASPFTAALDMLSHLAISRGEPNMIFLTKKKSKSVGSVI
jgi:hypothetical protein